MHEEYSMWYLVGLAGVLSLEVVYSKLSVSAWSAAGHMAQAGSHHLRHAKAWAGGKTKGQEVVE